MKYTDQIIDLMHETGRFRVLRRYIRPTAYQTATVDDDIRIGLIVDTETTGLADDAEIIELGAVLFEFSPDGRIFRILDAQSWFEEPTSPISPEITRVTGITNEMLKGQTIDDDAFDAMIARASLMIAHNAAFDRPKIERKFPSSSKKAWACTQTEIDWKGEGIGSTKLEFITYKLGFYYDAHRAATDCLALLHAMAQTLPISGKKALTTLLCHAREPVSRVWALRSPFPSKETLKARGYSWFDGVGGNEKSWYRDVAADQCDAELEFLNGIDGVRPLVSRLTAFDRFSERAWRQSASC